MQRFLVFTIILIFSFNYSSTSYALKYDSKITIENNYKSFLAQNNDNLFIEKKLEQGIFK